MKTTHVLRHLAWLFVLISLAACTDHLTLPTTPGSTTSRLRVRTLTQDLADNRQNVNLFRYDAQNRLSSILAYQTPDSTAAPVESSTYQYDGQNRLTQIRRVIGNASGPGELYTFTYNAAGQLAGISYNSSGNYSLTLRYNGSNQLAGSFENSANSIAGISYSEENEFIFTGSNLTTVNTRTRTVFRGPTSEQNFTTTFTHDDKRNPFHGLYLIPTPGSFFSPQFGNFGHSTYYGGFSNVLNLSMNNVLTTGTPTSYQYTYNAADLPIIRQTIVSGTTTETLRFDYETY